MAMPPASLRERSKLKRRAAIQRAAMRLFAERGYDRTTIADIAEEAELAPRTVSMYFPSKQDLALSTSTDMSDRLVAILEARPHGRFTEVIDEWLAGESESLDSDLGALTAAMLDANPALRAVSISQVADASSKAGPALIAETGLSPEDPMIRIVSAAIGGALSEYLRGASHTRSTRTSQQEFTRYLSAIIEAARPR
jgi:AcrR family transcriptional regulator